jgi:PleD family two-component response regulator
MTKKTRAPASRLVKSGKNGAGSRKIARRRDGQLKASAALADARQAVRRLKAQLAKATARIDELQASADTDFLLDIQVRSSDVIGRLGGDEFALLLWNLSEIDARAKAALLEQAVDELSFSFRGHAVTAGISAGIAILGSHAEAGRALEAADCAMYLRKAQRRHEA